MANMSRTEILLNRFTARFDGPENGRRWVFLHGLMGFHHNWRKIISGLEATEHCLSFDQRGHGRSYHPDGGYRPEDYAQDLKEILDHLGWEKIILVGHSMGGRNGLSFCAQWPGRVESFVMEDIGPEARAGNEEYYRTLLGTVPAPFPDRATARAFFSGEFLQRNAARENPGRLAEYFYANMHERPEGDFSWKFSPEAIFASVRAGEERDRWNEWRDLKVKTLLVRGERSTELSQEVYEKMLSENSLTRGIVINGAGHWVHADQPAEFLRALRSWSGLEPAGP